MAFAPTKPWKLPFITTWGGSPNRNLPTNSAEEAQRDRKRSIVALTVGFIIQALQILLGSAGRSVFSLDKYLSWMSQGLPHGRCCPFVVPRASELVLYVMYNIMRFEWDADKNRIVG